MRRYGGYRRGGGGMRFLIFLIFLAFAVYFLNTPFSFVQLPAFLISANKWIILGGGVLLVFGAISYLRSSSYRY
jgi:hypothetical protein